MQPDHFRRLFNYDAAANRMLLPPMRRTFRPKDQPARVFGHLIASPGVWLQRLNGAHDSTDSAWIDVDWDDLERRIEYNHGALNHYLDGATPQSLVTPIRYRTSNGDAFDSKPMDILHHIVLHGGYHRGQLARELRMRGIDPPPTDFIRWAREG